MSLVLIGFKNSGKTSVGKLASEKLKWNFSDTDNLVEEYFLSNYKSKLSTREIYNFLGKDNFRIMEQKIIENLSLRKSAIIATGGGAIIENKNLMYLKRLGSIVYLKVPFDTLLNRLSLSSVPPFLDANFLEESLSKHYQQREPYYQAAADVIIDVESQNVSQVADCLISLIRKH